MEQLDDVTTMVDGARLALAEGRWSDRQAIEDIARAVLLLVAAIEDQMDCGSARRDEPIGAAT